MILNCLFTAAITYYNSLHGFREGSGTGTATLEVNMLQQGAALREAILHEIFLDLHKAYDALDRSRCLGILGEYGMDTRSLRLLQRYWDRLEMVARVGGYYGSPLCGYIGVTQGDPLLPTILNVVVDVVVCYWESLVAEREGGDSSGDDGDGEQTAGRKIRD